MSEVEKIELLWCNFYIQVKQYFNIHGKSYTTAPKNGVESFAN
jgi:hypothetical protein